MPSPDRPSAFTSDAARERFHAAYDRALAGLWPVPVDARDVETRAPSRPGYADEQLRAVPVPVQVLLGAGSTLHDSPAVAARLAEVVPHWRVEVVPGTGHGLPLEAPDLVIDRILGFAAPERPGAPAPRTTAG